MMMLTIDKEIMKCRKDKNMTNMQNFYYQFIVTDQKNPFWLISESELQDIFANEFLTWAPW